MTSALTPVHDLLRQLRDLQRLAQQLGQVGAQAAVVVWAELTQHVVGDGYGVLVRIKAEELAQLPT